MVGMRSMPGSPYDGHTVDSALEPVQILTETTPAIVLADRGYRRAIPACGAPLLLSRPRKLPAKLRRRLVVEPMTRHMKTDGLLARNWLQGERGDAIHAVLCGAGHYLRTILACPPGTWRDRTSRLHSPWREAWMEPS